MPVPTISASEAAVELQNLRFEARSAKDYAWFDVGSFLNYGVCFVLFCFVFIFYKLSIPFQCPSISYLCMLFYWISLWHKFFQ
ncbi:hypothetical protein BUALT_Bualt07G0148600 [Buddleja alternifolia]|uniref:ATP synthase F0 subunit 8 n=1 Tax=Buddleja alternifolia TaxID=168488 RepID=A0AAV6XLD7_9LAMI|nr:hypothetical protein BUALT_Bualt07G0148600 [Buddleja alternifolia]